MEAGRDLSPEECKAFVRAGGLGRVGVSVSALPAIFPIRYYLCDDEIVVHGAYGTIPANALSGAIVAFEADSIDDRGHGWNVLVVGKAEAVIDGSDSLTRISCDRVCGRILAGSTS
jgi:nitroimidazol reductase NimA-like FMN-containing flavoprotein (pyridoxamine 5'-phosphate oxidase superfamily)